MRGDFTHVSVCVCFFCQVYVSFQFNRKLFRLFGFWIEFEHIISGLLYNGWVEVCHTNTQRTINNKKEAHIFGIDAILKRHAFKYTSRWYFAVSIYRIKCWLFLLVWCCCFFEISLFFCWKKIIYCFFIDILFHLAFFFAWWHTVKKEQGWLGPYMCYNKTMWLFFFWYTTNHIRLCLGIKHSV